MINGEDKIKCMPIADAHMMKISFRFLFAAQSSRCHSAEESQEEEASYVCRSQRAQEQLAGGDSEQEFVRRYAATFGGKRPLPKL